MNARDQAENGGPAEAEPAQGETLVEVVRAATDGALPGRGEGSRQPWILTNGTKERLTRIFSSRLLRPGGMGRLRCLLRPLWSVYSSASGRVGVRQLFAPDHDSTAVSHRGADAPKCGSATSWPARRFPAMRLPTFLAT